MMNKRLKGTKNKESVKCFVDRQNLKEILFQLV